MPETQSEPQHATEAPPVVEEPTVKTIKEQVDTLDCRVQGIECHLETTQKNIPNTLPNTTRFVQTPAKHALLEFM